MQHVAEVCKKHGIDMRVGIYNDIAFFDTIDKAHDTRNWRSQTFHFDEF